MDHAIFTGATPNYQVSATAVWQQHQENKAVFADNAQYECPHCHVKLKLTNLNKETPKRVYFYIAQTKVPHKSYCEAQDLSLDVYNEKYGAGLEEGGIIKDTKSLIFKQREQKEKIVNGESTEEDHIDIAKYTSSVVLSVDDYHKRRAIGYSLQKFYLEIKETNAWENVYAEMQWPHLKKDFSEDHNVQALKYNSAKLGDIVIPTKNNKKFELMRDYIFFGDAKISIEDTYYGKQFYIRFVDSDLEAHWGIKTLKGLTNIRKLREASETGEVIEIVLCGCFYKNKENELIFYRRTPNLGDFITIPTID
ncbi:hypothetical protein JC2156_00220 [Weissella koreensis KCTC 3621]|uniref:hypothetical protein n=1 Tax=Weissella koreensis TaxID=165096 RepID=UPI00026F1894|nr:hypothetical protein [Weissella koreensis]EJF34140.1 hypothetical protein JC2156_00220 [Weissella koreensis KCTC 3621]